MRVRVKFRYRAQTGEVELFDVEDLPDGTPAADHDARHDRAAADVARVIDPHALIKALEPGVERHARDIAARPRPAAHDQAGHTDQPEHQTDLVDQADGQASRPAAQAAIQPIRRATGTVRR